jgi:hypothetical protein
MKSHQANIDGVAFWAPTLPGWPVARAVLRGELPPTDPPLPVPSPSQLAPAERRRAPHSVALALAVAQEAVQASQHRPSGLLAVFASAHGDLPIIDTLCQTLVHTPTLVSPTRFLHSIHNAPVGLWSMLNSCELANTCISGASHSFAHGLLEALVQCEAEQRTVLYVAYDIGAVGALTHTTPSRGELAIALVLAPQSGQRSLAQIQWSLRPGGCDQPRCDAAATSALSLNAMAGCLPMAQALALALPKQLEWPLHARQTLRVEIEPLIAH